MRDSVHVNQVFLIVLTAYSCMPSRILTSNGQRKTPGLCPGVLGLRINAINIALRLFIRKAPRATTPRGHTRIKRNHQTELFKNYPTIIFNPGLQLPQVDL